MSYDINLYTKTFLRYATENKLGDLTGAPAFPTEVKDGAIRILEGPGFKRRVIDNEMAEFLKEEGDEYGVELECDSPKVLAEVYVFSGSISFGVPQSECASTSIQLCRSIAMRIRDDYDLGFEDPQTGELLY